jgi:hypothetical protein
VIDLRRAADAHGFTEFAGMLSEKVADMFKTDGAEGLVIAAQAWRAGDRGLARSGFLAAFQQAASALDGDALLDLPLEAIAEYLGDDRASGMELRVYRAAMRWTVHSLDVREQAGERFERAPWWTPEHEAEEKRIAKLMKERSSASAASSAALSSTVEDAKEAEPALAESKTADDDAVAVAVTPASVPLLSSHRRRSSGPYSSFEPTILVAEEEPPAEEDADDAAAESVASSDVSDRDFALGGLSELFKLSSTGSFPEIGAKSVKAKSPLREWLRASNDRVLWDEWEFAYDEMQPISARLTPKYSGRVLRETMGPLLHCIRFGQLPAWFLAREIAPMDILTAAELNASFQSAFLPPTLRPVSHLSMLGFNSAPRKPVETKLHITMWGGGGASGRYDDSGTGGAGGYLAVEYHLQPGEELDFYVGEGGYADESESTRTTQAWPNSGRGGYNWKTGSGGGATYFTSARFRGEVVAGAGGGGGGSAGRSYSSGGGGGGGTRDGKVGSGGDGQCPSGAEGIEGENGNGKGGHNDSSGSKKDGANANGGGGKHGASSNSDGGGGGEASWKHAKLLRKIDADGPRPVSCPVLGTSAGSGGAVKGFAKGGDKRRGKHGMVVIVVVDTGKKTTLRFKKEVLKFSLAG